MVAHLYLIFTHIGLGLIGGVEKVCSISEERPSSIPNNQTTPHLLIELLRQQVQHQSRNGGGGSGEFGSLVGNKGGLDSGGLKHGRYLIMVQNYLDDVQLLSFDLHKTLTLVLYRRVYKTQSIASVHQSVSEQTSCQHQLVVFSTMNDEDYESVRHRVKCRDIRGVIRELENGLTQDKKIVRYPYLHFHRPQLFTLLSLIQYPIHLAKYYKQVRELMSQSVQAKQADRLKKLRDLHIKRNEARVNNHQEVVEEDKQMKLPSNWEARQRKAEWLLNDDKLRQEAKEKGQDYNRLKLLNMTAMEADAIDRKKKRQNPDPGFSDYEEATARQYNRMISNMKVDMSAYQRQKDKLGKAFYAEANTYLHDKVKDSKEGIDRMVDDLEKQIAKRNKFSRRRTHNDEADIDYINERNMKFNAKLERYYGEHTTQIKQNLERGTAI
ncbi:hypothetical protein AGLY_011770 [Aphis glycines]|uniref:Pre-mRNA-splicing factor SYF2 n=1 Tax=Aphis glycines TaxID=307491 RepID=A0A6G0TDA7_APHGL|nr:hypothetical protein AGLY_011770 [Aphis glycines]